MEAARAMKVAIDAGASLDEMQRVLLKSVKPEDLFMAIRNAAQKEQQQNQSYQPQSQQHVASNGPRCACHESKSQQCTNRKNYING